MLFISSSKLFLFLRYLNFSPDLSGSVGKRLEIKAKVNFKILKLSTGKQIHTFCPTSQEVKAIRQ